MKITKVHLEHEIFSNCYLLTDEKTGEGAVVDPAWYGDALKTAIGNTKIKYILLTHGHFDHIYGVHGLKEASGASVVIHPNDADHLKDPKKSLAESNMPQKQTPVEADILVNDGDVLFLGDEKITVMHTPGHTMGSVCYIVESDRVIFSGDTLFCMTAGRTDFFDGSDEKMAESLKKLVALEGDFRVLPGHNRETTLESERKRNWYIRRMV